MNIQLSGVEDVLKNISSEQLSKTFYKGLASVANQTHLAITRSVNNRYMLADTVDSIRIGKTSSTVKTGQNFFTSSLEYRWKPRDLSKFPYRRYWGALNEGFGYVHEVKILRKGSYKVVAGKDHRGGFVPKDKTGQVWRGKYGAQMFERKSSARKPVRVLYGPATANLILHQLRKDNALQKDIDNIVDAFAREFVNAGV